MVRIKKRDDHNNRWHWDGEKYGYTTSMLNDYENVLSALIALKNKQQESYIEQCREKDVLNISHELVPEMVDETLKNIWDVVFPHRGISVLDGKVTATVVNSDSTDSYSGRYMSDGERVALYLIAQTLCIPENKVIIIDEPEIHLHRSIMNRLWSELEKQDQIVFLYI